MLKSTTLLRTKRYYYSGPVAMTLFKKISLLILYLGFGGIFGVFLSSVLVLNIL
nr:unnamed protein product [Meloidogyne enterolobii]